MESRWWKKFCHYKCGKNLIVDNNQKKKKCEVNDLQRQCSWKTKTLDIYSNKLLKALKLY